jgi:hypothetical protein
MTGFGALVLLPPTPPQLVEAAVGEALRPFAGRWWIDGDLLFRPEYDGHPALVRRPGQGALRCAGGPKRMLDFDGMRARAAASARVQWWAWQLHRIPGDDAGENPERFFGSDERAFLERRAAEAGVAGTVVTLGRRWVGGGRRAAELATLSDEALVIHLVCRP